MRTEEAQNKLIDSTDKKVTIEAKRNISDVDCCATRLRVTVKEPDKVDEVALKSGGASGVIKKGNGIQIIYGPKVTVIKSEIEEYIKSLEK